jgi:polyisoprenyl-phosphate glycosyltransferase
LADFSLFLKYIGYNYTMSDNTLISFVIPAYNEALGLAEFHASLTHVASLGDYDYEIIYCDDGSTDDTPKLVKQWHDADKKIKLVKLSRNFGKESALTAGIAAARGDVIITLDADGQHPVSKIPEFINAWDMGSQVVVGIRSNFSGNGFMKTIGPKLFNKVFNQITGQKTEIGSSDFRLITKSVQKSFLELTENDRATRDLIDWLGYKRSFVSYEASDRYAGEATYNTKMLFKLAADRFVSSSPRPLYLFGYLGVIITVFSFMLGGLVILEQLILNDPLDWNFTGTAMLGVLILFLVGIILMSQGILSLYISRIHSQSKKRPLFVIDSDSSLGLNKSFK